MPTGTSPHGLPALFGFALDSLVGCGVQQSPNVAPPNALGRPFQNRRKRALQPALDFLCSPQPARHPPSNVKLDQLPHRDTQRCGRTSFPFLGYQILAGPRRAGQLVGALAGMFEAHVRQSAQRHPADLPRPPDAVGQIPSLDATGSHANSQADAALIGHPEGRFRGPQSVY
jgi:hypothetical protein